VQRHHRIDQCTVCHGIFLDRGELERLIGAESSYLGAHSAMVRNRTMTGASSATSSTTSGPEPHGVRAELDLRACRGGAAGGEDPALAALRGRRLTGGATMGWPLPVCLVGCRSVAGPILLVETLLHGRGFGADAAAGTLLGSRP